MNLDWLFGPKTARHPAAPDDDLGALRVRSQTLDTTDLFDIADLLDRKLPGEPAAFTIQRKVSAQQVETRQVDRQEVAALAAIDRRRLMLDKTFNTPEVQASASVSFLAGHPSVYTSKGYEHVRTEIVEILLENGRSRPHWGLLRRRGGALAPAGILAALFVWTEFSVPLPLPVHLLGWVGVALVSVSGLNRLRATVPYFFPVPGHRIRPESREKTAARRADTWRDLKVSVVTAPSAIAVAVIIAWLSGWLRFGD